MGAIKRKQWGKRVDGRDESGRRLWRDTSLPYATVYNRLARGWTLEEAVNTPLIKKESMRD